MDLDQLKQLVVVNLGKIVAGRGRGRSGRRGGAVVTARLSAILVAAADKLDWEKINALLK